MDETARFDRHGLWSFQSVWFSRHGTLLDTAEAFVEDSQGGCFVQELDAVLHVGTKEPLLRLVRQERITRQPIDGLFLYCSSDPQQRERQLLARRLLHSEAGVATGVAKVEQVSSELKAAIALFFSSLDEKHRRLYAGVESLKFGYGGDRRIAGFLGMDPHTVAKGRQELLRQDLQLDSIRKAGGGRKRVEKKLPKSSPTSKN